MSSTSTLASPNCDISKLKNGQEITGVDGYCDLCHSAFGGSFTLRAAIFLDGKFYHPECFPKATEIYLAKQKLI